MEKRTQGIIEIIKYQYDVDTFVNLINYDDTKKQELIDKIIQIVIRDCGYFINAKEKEQIKVESFNYFKNSTGKKLNIFID